MSDPTKAELEAVAAKLDAKELEDFKIGLRNGAIMERLNHPCLLCTAFYDFGTDFLKWLMRLRLPVVDMIPPHERTLLYYREMTDRGKAQLRALVVADDHPTHKIDLATGEHFPSDAA